MARRFRLRGSISKSFLERNQRLIGAIAVVAITLGTGFALLLSGGVFARQYHVTAFFTDAAGIVPGDQVTVAGLPAGTVRKLRIEQGRVAMDLGIDKSVTLTSDTRAAVIIQTLLGRETVSLIDGAAPGTLRQGSVIPVDRTTTPVNITQLGDISVNLLQHSDAQAFNSFLAELTGILSGKGQQVGQLVTGLGQLTQAIDARRQQLGHLIGSLASLSTTLGERSGVIVSLIDNLNPVLADLQARQRDIAAFLQATQAGSNETASLVERDRGVLDQTLNALHQDLLTIDQHQVDLAATIDYLNQAVQGYSSVGFSGNTPNTWANIFVQSLGPAGVDALLGQCGAVDQLIDQVLGTSCQTAPPPSLPGLPKLPPVPAPGIPTPSLPPLPGIPLPSLPGVPGLPIPPAPSTSPLPLPTPSLPGIGLPIGAAATSMALPSSVGDLFGWMFLGGGSR